jgi:hypothetical protein
MGDAPKAMGHGIKQRDRVRIGVKAMLHKRVIVELQPTRVTSWDHRKLGLPPMPVHA